jgi:hypothetical protein
MSDAELPDGVLPDVDEVDQGNTDNDGDEEPVIPRDDNRAVTNDAVAGEPEDEEIDLDDTLEWGQLDTPLTGGRESVDAGDRETAGDLDGPLSDYDALTRDPPPER